VRVPRNTWDSKKRFHTKMQSRQTRREIKTEKGTIKYLYYLAAFNFSSERALHRVQRIAAFGNQRNTLVTTQHV